MEGPVRPLASAEDELAYLRAEVARKEAELIGLRETPNREAVAYERITHHGAQPAGEVLAPTYQVPEARIHEIALNLDPESDDETMAELKSVMETQGIKNALSVLEKLNNPHLEDDFHRFLVAYVLAGMPVSGIGESATEWKALHMTLFEVALPEAPSGEGTDQVRKTLKELLSSMEQFYAGMLSVQEAKETELPYFSLELAIPVDSPQLRFYVSVPHSRKDLFSKQLHGIFPNAVIREQPNDYNVFVTEGATAVSSAAFKDVAVMPLKDFTDFDYDPLNSLLGAFGKIAPEAEGAALQIIVRPAGAHYASYYRRILHELERGATRAKAFALPETFIGDLAKEAFSIFTSSKKAPDPSRADKTAIELVQKKLATPIVESNIRLVASSRDPQRTALIMDELEASFHQYENTLGNRLSFARITGGSGLRSFIKKFSYRIYSTSQKLPISLRELTTMYHFPPKGVESAPQLVQSRFTTAPAPQELPQAGLLLGTNSYRGGETPVRIAPEDRMRHMYVIGQTGTGKTSYMKTLIEQDIKAGNGVCFIDPHGNDILDILATIPPERYEDVIYFDPAELTRPFGLNMLEYDPARPEQKSFIVNEMLMIFRQLYGDVPESMGPAFEQYFRNATQLVMEDPSSGSTLMDIGRVLSNKEFRDLKLSRSNNPIVNQFWNEIATQAEGEASLQNIVPYITNKFDEFTANDFMRPIIGQQESSFTFRDVMDSKKILLVNLSKGRLGERNANLLGLIIVGKIFMAALSRADNPRADFAPFYLYIDEFQNITTSSIPGILSEARKYKLSLTIAHQFLGQVDEKIRDAVFGNVGSMSVFRVGQEDAEFFEKQFAPVFKALDFTSIENYNAYVKILAGGVPQKPFNIHSLPPPKGNLQQVDDLRELSYLTYGRDRATIEATIRERYLS
jgi:hypothetical protein